MIDTSGKVETLRSAVAETRVKARRETIDRLLRGETPKGEVLSVARAAAVLAAKKTAELIPYCHPIPLDHVEVHFEDERGGEKGSALKITVTVRAIGKTGVEMEALVAASVAALTVYDMAKGIDPDVVIGETRLREKRGGKGDWEERLLTPLRAAILVTSDSVAKGKKEDRSGKMIAEEMRRLPVEVCHFEIVPDERDAIRSKILAWVEEGIQLVLTTGGTGLGPRDVTSEVVREVIDREVPGVGEAIRAFGQKRTPYAMLSREVVGVKGKSLIVALPGSSRGVQESIRAVFPSLLHIFNMMGGGGH